MLVCYGIEKQNKTPRGYRLLSVVCPESFEISIGERDQSNRGIFVLTVTYSAPRFIIQGSSEPGHPQSGSQHFDWVTLFNNGAVGQEAHFISLTK